MKRFQSPFVYLFTVVMTIFYMAVQPSYSAVSDPSITMNPLEGQVSEEGIARFTLPEALIKSALIEHLVANEAMPERYLKKINHLEIDPIQNLIILEGEALIPQGVVEDMNAIAGGEIFTAAHDFRLILKLPSAQKLSLTRYFVFEIVELNVGGQDYTSGVSRIGEFLATMLSHSSFMDWILKDPEAPMPSTEDEDRESLKIKRLFDSKEVMIRNQSVYLKLDLSQIAALAPYVMLSEFRLWNVSAVQLKGTKFHALQVEAGLGKPGERWFQAIAERGEGDARSVEEAQAELYETLGNREALTKELTSYSLVTKTSLNFPHWNEVQQNQLEELHVRLEQRVRKGLSLENPLFKANPQLGHDTTKEEVKEFILNTLLEMKREALAEAKVIEGGNVKNGMPLLGQRVSQRALNQGLRFARDFQFENKQMFAELEVVLAPHLSGVIIRGLMNVDVNTFMELGLEGEGIDWGNTPWNIASDIWNKSLPFELSLRLHMFDEGEIGLDVKNFSILKGSEKIQLTKNNGHGHLMVTWTKMAIVEALTTLAFDDPEDALSESSGDSEEDIFFKKAITKINEQVVEYSRQSRSNLSEDQLLKIAEIDITKNPFNQVGEEVVTTKVKYLFNDLVRFDDSTELVVFKIDPKLVAEKIYESSNNLQVWNLESLFDSKLNQTFVEATIGDGTRSKDYIQNIMNREERADSKKFSGLDANEKTASSDLITTMKFSYFTNFINGIFSDASQKQLKAVESLLTENKEQSHVVIRDLNVGATESNRLKLAMTVQTIDKEKRGVLARLFSDDFKVSRKTVQVAATLNLTTEALSKYKNQLTLAPKEVFFGDEVLAIDLESVGLNISGDTGVLDKAANLIAGNINFKGSLAKKAKVLVLSFLKKYLHSTDSKENGNVELGGVKINRFAKILTHKEELLIQLNPHLATVAFDLRSVVNQDFNGKAIGTVISKADDSISFHFSTSGNMAAVDKGELFNIMKDSRKIFKEVSELQEISPDQIMRIYDKTIYNSDYSKMSLMHRLSRVLKNYQGVSELVKPDATVVNAINAAINADFGLTSGEFNARYLSGSGVEVMYFLSAAYYLRSGLESIIDKVEAQNLDIPYLVDMKFKARELTERFISPLLETYETHFLTNNKNIMSKGPSDWNYTYYSDALYCQNVYSIVSNINKNKDLMKGTKGE